MASVLSSLFHCATGGLDELQAIQGSPTVQSTTKYSGAYAYKLAGATTRAFIVKQYTDTVADPSTHTIIAKVYFTDVSPASAYMFMGLNIDGGNFSNSNLALELQADGDVAVYRTNAGTLIGTITAPLTANTWHTIRVDYHADGSSGGVRVEIDGSGSEWSGFDSLVSSAIIHLTFAGPPASGDGDLYIDCAASWATTTWKPTDLPADIAVGNGHATGDTSATDLGDALGSGTWDDAGELPFSDSNSVGHSSSSASSGTDTDDGSNSGVSGDTYSPAIGTVLGAEIGMRADRGNGGGTTHTIYGGSSGDTWSGGLQSAAVTLLTSASYHSLLLDGATEAPTTSEYFRFGFGVSGAKDITVYDMVGVLLYEPAPAGGWGGSVGGVSSPAKVGGVAPGKVGGV